MSGQKYHLYGTKKKNGGPWVAIYIDAENEGVKQAGGVKAILQKKAMDKARSHFNSVSVGTQRSGWYEWTLEEIHDRMKTYKDILDEKSMEAHQRGVTIIEKEQQREHQSMLLRSSASRNACAIK